MHTSIPAALAALVLGLPVLFDAAPASAAASYLELNPSTVPAGDEVGLRASCDDNLKSATVSSTAFGSVQVTPQYGLLTATKRVPSRVEPGDYRVELTCPDGKTTASATLHVVAKVEPARGPATGGGGTAPDRYASTMIAGGLLVLAAGATLAVLSLRRRRFG